MYLPLSPSPDQAHEFARAFSRLLGWSYFFCWGISFYPQLVINYRRKSVTGLALDFFAANILGFACYTVSSMLLMFSPIVREQYAKRHPLSPEPTVRWNDLAFAAHATVLTIVTFSQFYLWGYSRDTTQRLSRPMRFFIAGCISAVIISVLLAFAETWEWIDVVYVLQYVKIAISIVKYVPQALLNYERKATTGWSIENILLDLSGGVLSFAQLLLDSSMQDDWSGVTGNPVKFFLSQISILFDSVFITQHYVLYRSSTPVHRAVETGYGTLPTGGIPPGANDGRKPTGRTSERNEEGKVWTGEEDGERRPLVGGLKETMEGAGVIED